MSRFSANSISRALAETAENDVRTSVRAATSDSPAAARIRLAIALGVSPAAKPIVSSAAMLNFTAARQELIHSAIMCPLRGDADASDSKICGCGDAIDHRIRAVFVPALMAPASRICSYLRIDVAASSGGRAQFPSQLRKRWQALQRLPMISPMF